jgi:hypothetical protein
MRPGRSQCNVRDPELVRVIRNELPLNSAHGMRIRGLGFLSERCFSPPHASNPTAFHDPGYLVSPGEPALKANHQIHFPHPLDAIVRGMQSLQLITEDLVNDCTIRHRSALGAPIAATSHELARGLA